MSATSGDKSVRAIFIEEGGTTNLPPTAANLTESGSEDAPWNILLSASDPEGANLTYTIADPTSGNLTGTVPNLVYAPNENFNGSDSFTYSVSDEELESNMATVSITVIAVNDQPIANPLSGRLVLPGEPQELTLTGSDLESGNQITYQWSAPGNGSVRLLRGNNVLEYTPNQGFENTDTFTFTVSDGELLSAPATVSIPVFGLAYQTYILPIPEDAEEVFVAGINNQGHVVGIVSGDNYPISQPIFWDSTSGYELMQLSANIESLRIGTQNELINDSDIVMIGGVDASTGAGATFIWEGANLTRTITLTGSQSVFIQKVTDTGFGAGNTVDNNGIPYWLTYNHHTLDLNVHTPEAVSIALAYGVNTNGGIFGHTVSDNYKMWLYENNTYSNVTPVDWGVIVDYNENGYIAHRTLADTIVIRHPDEGIVAELGRHFIGNGDLNNNNQFVCASAEGPYIHDGSTLLDVESEAYVHGYDIEEGMKNNYRFYINDNGMMAGTILNSEDKLRPIVFIPN